MSKVLSQQEIDLLMESVKSGEIDTELVEEAEPVKIKTYDFRRPARLSKEYMTTLTMLLEEYAKIASNLITTQVRSNVTLRVASIEQISFDEFLHSVPNFTLMGLFRSEPQEGYADCRNQFSSLSAVIAVVMRQPGYKTIKYRKQQRQLYGYRDCHFGRSGRQFWACTTIGFQGYRGVERYDGSDGNECAAAADDVPQ